MKENRLVVADIGWAETIPDWLKKAVETERLGEGFADVLGKGNDGRAGLAEVCVYLYTASLRHGLDYHHGQIYFYVMGKVTERHQGKAPDLPFVKEVLEKGLDVDEQRLLDQLRSELYRKRGGVIRHPLFDALKTLRKEIFSQAPAKNPRQGR